MTQRNYLQQREAPTGEATSEEAARAQTLLEAPSVTNIQEEPPRGRKPRDTDSIGLKSRFSFQEPPANTGTDYVPQEEVQSKRKEAIQDRVHKTVTTTL